MHETPEKKPALVRIDPSLHLIMRGIKDVLHIGSLEETYSMAIFEFIINHPEIVEPVLQQLATEKSIILGSVEKLQATRTSIV